MSGLFSIDTPHRNGNKIPDGSDMGISFDDVESFVEPAPKLANNRSRAPLLALSENARKGAEFTPILRTATKRNRLISYETPGNKGDSSHSQTMDNSAITPITWNPKKNLVGDKSNISINTSARSSPGLMSLPNGPGGIREQEKAMDKMKNENWELKLKVFLLEKQMHKSAPEHVQIALRENIDYKIQVTLLSKDVVKYKRALAETERKVASLGDQVSQSLLQEECHLQHGMSPEELEKFETLCMERDTWLNDKEELAMRVRELEEENDTLKSSEERRRELETHLEELEAALDQAKDREDELVTEQGRTHSLEEQLTNLHDEIESLQMRHDDLLSQTRSGDNDEVIELLRTQLEEKNDTIKNLSSHSKQTDREVTSLQTRVDSLTSQIQALEDRNDSLEADLEIKEDLQSKTEAAKESLEIEKGTLELQLAALNKENSEIHQRLTILEQEITDTQHELREREEDIEELKGAAMDQSFEYHQLEAKLLMRNATTKQDSNDAIQDLENQVSEWKLASREHERAARDLTDKLSTVEKRMQMIQERDDVKNDRVQELETEALERKSISHVLERDLTSAQQKITVLNTRVHELEVQVRDLESSDDFDTTQVQDRLREENQELRETIESLEMQIREKEEELDLLGDEVSQANAELVELRQTSSESSTLSATQQSQLESAKNQVMELRRLLQTSQDKAIFVDDARAKLQQQLADAKQIASEQEQKAVALNTSLLHVRTLLSETQATHKTETQVISQARQAENSLAMQRYADLESNLAGQISAHERTLAEAKSVRSALETKLEGHRDQIQSLEKTVRQFSDNEETVNIDQKRYKNAFEAELERHKLSEYDAQMHLQELEASRSSLMEQVESHYQKLQILEAELRSVRADDLQKSLEVSRLQAISKSLEQELTLSRDAEAEVGSSEKILRLRLDSCESKLFMLQDSLSQARRSHQDDLLKKSDELFAETQKVNNLADQLHDAESRCLSGDHERRRLELGLHSADQRLLSNAARITELTEEKQMLEAKLGDFSDQDVARISVASEISQARNDLSSCKISLASAQTELEEVSAERDLLHCQISEVTNNMEQLRIETTATIRQLRGELHNAQETLQQESARLNEMEALARAAAKEETQKAAQDHGRLTQLVSELQESLSLSKKNYQDLLASVGSNDSQLLTIRASLTILQEELDLAKRQNETLENKAGDNDAAQIIEELEAQLSELEADLEESKVDSDACLAKLRAELDDAVFKHEREITKLNDHAEGLLLQLREVESRSEGFREVREVLEKKISDQEMVIIQVTKDARFNRQASRDLSMNIGHVESLTKDRDELKRQLGAASKEILSLRDSIKTLQTESSSDRKSESRLSEQLKRAQRAVKALESELEAKDRKVNDLRTASNQKTDRNAALEQRLLVLQSQISTRSSQDRGGIHRSDEMAGLTKLLRYMRSRTAREESFRADLAYVKSYYDKQIASFEACNQANLAIIQQIGIFPNEDIRKRKPTFKNAAHLVIAVIKMKNAAALWSFERAEKNKIDEAMKQRKRRDAGRPVK